jgi:hypothetical protein
MDELGPSYTPDNELQQEPIPAIATLATPDELLAASSSDTQPGKLRRAAGMILSGCRHNGLFMVYEVFDDLQKQADAEKSLDEPTPTACANPDSAQTDDLK